MNAKISIEEIKRSSRSLEDVYIDLVHEGGEGMRTTGPVLIVARKELHEMLLNKWTLVSAAIFAMLFGLVSGAVTTVPGQPASLDGHILYLAPFIGAFTGFILCGAVFFREKQSGVVETLLCTPLDLRSIWMGKVIGVTVPAFMMSLLAVIVSYGFSIITYGAVSAPSLIIIVHVLVVTPIFTAAAIGSAISSSPWE